MFFDNDSYFSFVERCRQSGITVPIIPGIKPIGTKGQLTVLPKVFHVDIPTDLARAVMDCKDDVQAKEVGVEWMAMQMRGLYEAGVPSVHIYSLNATRSVEKALRLVL